MDLTYSIHTAEVGNLSVAESVSAIHACMGAIGAVGVMTIDAKKDRLCSQQCWVDVAFLHALTPYPGEPLASGES